MAEASSTPTAFHPDPAQFLLDVHLIHELKARYCRYLDTKQWDLMPDLFAADARFEGFGSAPTGADAAMFVSGLSTRLKDAITIHHCHMPEIAFTSATAARGIWAMMDYVEFPPGQVSKEAMGQRGFFGYGHYQEEYCKEGGVWRIAFARLTRMRIDPVAADPFARRETLLAAVPGWLGTERAG